MKQFALFQSGRPIIMSASNTRKHSRTNWKRVDRLKDEEIDYSEIPQLGPNFLQRPYAGQAKRSRLRCALIQTFWLSFESTGKVIKPLSTRSFENMSRVASGARASCYTVSARALKFHTESRTKPYSPMPHARARPRSTHPSNRAGLLRLRQKHLAVRSHPPRSNPSRCGPRWAHSVRG